MSEVLRCKPNIAEQIALKFADGINVSGEYGNQVLYTLADNRKLYVPRIVAEKIKDLKIGAEERFSLCKRTAPGNRVSWEINRMEPPASGPRIAPPVNSQAAAVSPSQNTQHSNGNRQETLTQLGNVLKNGMPGLASATAGQMTGQSQYCLQQLVSAIDLVHAAEKYAAAIGRPVKFTSEDIRAIGISCFIQQHKGTY
jgi:hypothetical protein